MLSTEIVIVTVTKPVIIGATGIVTNVLRKNLEAIPGNHSIDYYKRELYLEHHI
jgi:hypothetical protein